MEQMVRIIAAASEPYKTFFWLAAETGMRCGELCGLRWPDVNWSAVSCQCGELTSGEVSLIL